MQGDVRIELWICNPENCRHHRFGSFVPKIAVVLDDAGVDFDIPVRHIDVANLLYLPEIEFAVRSDSPQGHPALETNREHKLSADVFTLDAER